MFKKRYLFLILLVCLFAISAVSAEDNSTSDIVSVSNDNSNLETNILEINEDSTTESANDTDTLKMSNDKVLTAENNNWYVNSSKTSSGDGKSDASAFVSLREAIDKASADDTINIASGEYKGTNNTGLTINKNLNFIKYGNAEAIFDAEGLSRIWNVIATSINITCLTFKNGKAENGGAIYFDYSGSVTDCIFTGNTATNTGGAIYFDYSGSVTDCIFTGNTATYAGAIYFDYSGSVTDCIFTGNTATYAGAIYYAKGSVTNCTFENCSSSGSSGSGGGAIDIGSGNVTNCSFVNCNSISRYSYGGAIFINSGNVTNCSFVNCSSSHRDSYGGAIFINSGNVTNCSFVNCSSDSGGAIYFYDDGITKIGSVTDCTFIHNNAIRNAGGAIYFYYSGSVTNCAFIHNNAIRNAGGAIYFDYGGSVTNCAFVNNIARYRMGNAIYSGMEMWSIDNNWWGSNNPNWNELIHNGQTPSVYAVLNVSANPSEIYIDEKSDIVTKFVWKGTNTDATNFLPKRNIKLLSNGTLTVTEGDVGLTSEFSATTRGIYYVNANVDNEMLGVNVVVNPKSKENLTISASAEPITVGENATVVVTGFENATGNVTARVEGGSLYVPIVNGTATFTVPDLTSSTTAYIIYEGDANYNPASTTVDITVIPESEVIIVADDVVKYYGGPERFVANVYDSAMNPIANKSVSIKINGITYTRTTDSNGTVSLAIRLGSGTYYVTTTVDNTTKESMVSVLSTIDGADITKYYKNDTQYSVLVCDATGKAVGAGEVVTFNVNGVFYNRTTDANGIATLNINLPPGEYVITAINHVTGEMQSNNITVLPVLSANDLTMKYLDGSQFKANLVDGQGKPYKDQTVTFNVNGILYNKVTDSNGQAALNIRLPPGEYIITSSFNGVNVANKITITG